jgi:PTH1 family peptidyl-tRNA hydrolase
LGNPGPEYAETRHNAGFLFLDRLRMRNGFDLVSETRDYRLWLGKWYDHRVYLMAPQTFMNLSGSAVAAFLRESPLALEDLLIAYDDLALPVGVIRLRAGGSAGGQKGMRHIIDTLGSKSIPRLRIGIGAPLAGEPGEQRRESVVDHVLSHFDPAERPVFDKSLERAADAVEMWLRQDMQRVMGSFNGLPVVDLSEP